MTKQIELSALYAASVLVFLEHLEDLGYTEDQGTIREWLESFTDEEQKKKFDVLLDYLEAAAYPEEDDEDEED